MVARVFSFLALCAAAFAKEEALYQPFLDQMMSDPDMGGVGEDGKVQCSEVELLIEKLDIGKIITAAELCDDVDTNNDDAIDETELGAYFAGEDAQGIIEEIINKFIGVPEGGPDIELDNPVIKEAVKQLDVAMTLDIDLSKLLPGDKKLIKANIKKEIAPDLSDDAVTVSFSRARSADSRALSAVQRRKLAAIAGKTDIEAKFFFDDADEADEATEAAEMKFGDPAAATASLAIPYISVSATSVESVFTPGTAPLNIPVPAAIGGVTLVLCVVACCLAKIFAKKTRTSQNVSYTTRCDTGCCSVYAIKGWSFSVGIACIFLIAGGVLLFLAMDDTTEAIICLINNLKAEELLKITQVKDSVENIQEYLTYIEPIEPYLNLLGVAVILPAALNIVFLGFGALCACRKSATMCCGKFFMFLAHIFSILCIVFYLIFAGLAIAVKFPVVRAQLSMVTSICEITLPSLQNMVEAALSAITQPNIDPTDPKLLDYTTQATDGEEAFAILFAMCDCMTTIIQEFTDLFVPGCVSTLAAIFAFFVNDALCCSAKCCKAPQVTGGSSKDDVLQNV